MISKNRKRRRLRKQIEDKTNAYNGYQRQLGTDKRMTKLEVAKELQANSNVLPKSERISFGPGTKIRRPEKKRQENSTYLPFKKNENERNRLRKLKRKTT